jgi:hypothetical protein
MRKLPKYKLKIDEDINGNQPEGWIRTSFVKNPAIIIKGLALSAVEEKKFVFTDDLKYQIAAPALLPFQTYRNQEGEEFYVEFTKEDVLKIHQKFMKNLDNKKQMFNVEHSDSIAPAFLLQAWVVEKPLEDKAYTTFGIEVPENTIFFVTQFEDKEFYNKLVREGATGLSIEGMFGMELMMSEVIDEEENNNKQKQTEIKMDELKNLEGKKFKVDDKWYEVKDGHVVEYVEAQAEVAASEDVPAEVEMADVPAQDVAVDAPAQDEVIAEPAHDNYNKEEIDAKFEEVFAMLAEIKVSIEGLSAPVAASEQKFSIQNNTNKTIVDSFVAFRNRK